MFKVKVTGQSEKENNKVLEVNFHILHSIFISLGITFGTKSANFVESDLGCIRVYFDNVTPMPLKQCHHNNKFDSSETNNYSIPQDDTIY